MIKTITFPIKEPFVKPNEYNHHYLFIKKYAECAGIKVRMSSRTDKVFCTSTTCFSVLVDNQQVFFDYSDHQSLSCYLPSLPYFKYHYSDRIFSSHLNVFPVGPMLDIPDSSGYQLFFNLCEQRIYQCNNSTIINCQLPRHNALQRRMLVQQMLIQRYGNHADISFKKEEQILFWCKHENCLVAVCVPGARNNMLDRGHYEQIALGVCTISPFITTTLPYHKKLIPNEHYLVCNDDYSNLIELIEWCKVNRDHCRQIGSAAWELFRNYCRPEKYWQWVENCIEYRK